jgi:hypothetical protein
MSAISLILLGFAASALILYGVGCCSAERHIGIVGAVGTLDGTIELRIRLTKNPQL